MKVVLTKFNLILKNIIIKYTIYRFRFLLRDKTNLVFEIKDKLSIMLDDFKNKIEQMISHNFKNIESMLIFSFMLLKYLFSTKIIWCFYMAGWKGIRRPMANRKINMEKKNTLTQKEKSRNSMEGKKVK